MKSLAGNTKFVNKEIIYKIQYPNYCVWLNGNRGQINLGLQFREGTTIAQQKIMILDNIPKNPKYKYTIVSELDDQKYSDYVVIIAELIKASPKKTCYSVESLKTQMELLQQRLNLVIAQQKNEPKCEDDKLTQLKTKESSSIVEKNECTICLENLANTAPVPCGHMKFCYNCISNYHLNYPEKGCPICRSKINTVCKIFK